MHETATVDGILEYPVHRAGVVPHQQVTGLPLVPVDVLRLGGPITKARKQCAALLDRHADHVIRCRAEQQRLAAGLMRPHDGARLRRRLLPERDLVVAHLGTNVVLRAFGAVHHPKIGDARPCRMRQVVVGRVGVAELRLTTGFRQRDGPQQGGEIRVGLQ